tara:strand:- start:48 stop:347 length:300 start_codon:yes stop_codon:yes gene_type:complete
MNNINLNAERFSQEESRSMDNIHQEVYNFEKLRKLCSDNRHSYKNSGAFDNLLRGANKQETYVNYLIMIHCKTFDQPTFTIDDVMYSESYENAFFRGGK